MVQIQRYGRPAGEVIYVPSRYHIQYLLDGSPVGTLNYNPLDDPVRRYYVPTEKQYLDLLNYFLPEPTVPITNYEISCTTRRDPQFMTVVDKGEITDPEMIEYTRRCFPQLFRFPNVKTDYMTVEWGWSKDLKITAYSHVVPNIDLINYLIDQTENDESHLQTLDVREVAKLVGFTN